MRLNRQLYRVWIIFAALTMHGSLFQNAFGDNQQPSWENRRDLSKTAKSYLPDVIQKMTKAGYSNVVPVASRSRGYDRGRLLMAARDQKNRKVFLHFDFQQLPGTDGDFYSTGMNKHWRMGAPMRINSNPRPWNLLARYRNHRFFKAWHHYDDGSLMLGRGDWFSLERGKQFRKDPADLTVMAHTRVLPFAKNRTAEPVFTLGSTDLSNP